MADVYVADMPSVKIGATEYICHMRKVRLIPTDVMADIETFCDPGGERPSSTSWMAEFDIAQSFDTAGAWNLLRALAKTKQTFIIKPADAAVGVTNPSATVSAWVPSIPFTDSEIGKATIYTLKCKVVGQPVFALT